MMNELTIILGDWNTLQKDAQAIRHEVFVLEQHIPADLEWDVMDALCDPLGGSRIALGNAVGLFRHPFSPAIRLRSMISFSASSRSRGDDSRAALAVP